MSFSTAVYNPEAPNIARDMLSGVRRSLNTSSTGAQGGFLCSVELASEVWGKARALDGPLQRCLFRATTQSSFEWPMFDETSRANGNRLGGIKHAWQGDDRSSLSPYLSQPSVGMVEFTPERCIVFSTLSNDLLADVDNASFALSDAAQQEIRYALVDGMINGHGIKRPLGVIQAPSTITVSRAGANNIAVADVDALWSRLWGFCRRNAVWICNDDTLLKLDAVAAAGGWLSNIYLPQGMYGNPYPLLKGRPVIACEACPALGSPGDLILGDWSQYCLVARTLTQGGPPEIEGNAEVHLHGGYGAVFEKYIEARQSDQVFFSNDITALVWKLRVDGKPLWKKPITIADGSQTAGPFCILSA